MITLRITARREWRAAVGGGSGATGGGGVGGGEGEKLSMAFRRTTADIFTTALPFTRRRRRGVARFESAQVKRNVNFGKRRSPRIHHMRTAKLLSANIGCFLEGDAHRLTSMRLCLFRNLTKERERTCSSPTVFTETSLRLCAKDVRDSRYRRRGDRPCGNSAGRYQRIARCLR